MKKSIIIALVFLISSAALFAQEKAGKQDTTQHAVFYSCPIHGDVTTNTPGKCPKCGMDDLIVSKKEQMKSEVSKTYTCPLHLDMTFDKEGKCPKCGKMLILSKKEQMKAEIVKIYTCPMHPDVASDKSGKCPKCGMALTEKKQR
jgi:predicted RNA-binding Zn-ribbon protein involved in translation (DUF1610 family)